MDPLPPLENVGQTRLMQEAGIGLIFCSMILALFFIISLGLSPSFQTYNVIAVSPPDSFAHVPLEARAAIVYDLATHTTLFAKEAGAQVPLASLTKLLTVVGALNELGPNFPITLSQNDELVDTPRRFVPGDTLALSDLARLTLTASLNDGASAIATAAAEREGTTTSSMLAAAASALGLEETYALNGSGLDVSPNLAGGYGSARDVAVLAGALVDKAPEVALATTLPKSSARTEKGKTYEILNTNPTVAYTPRLLLSKTGYTDLAGGNLALVFDAGINHPVAIVVLGSTEFARFTDGEALVAATLAHFSNIASL